MTQREQLIMDMHDRRTRAVEIARQLGLAQSYVEKRIREYSADHRSRHKTAMARGNRQFLIALADALDARALAKAA